MKIRTVFGALCCLFIAVGAASAHHSISAEFDPGRTFSVTGVLTRIEWTNPHSYFFVDVKGDDGKTVEYSFESYPVIGLHRAGMTKADWRIGETVTVTALAPKDGTRHLGFARTVKYQDGRVLTFRNGGE